MRDVERSVGRAIPELLRPRFAHRVVRELRSARAYRDGHLVCGRVTVTVATDDRLGLAPRERRRYVGARFTARVDPILRGELAAVACRRGAAARRAAERMEPIEVVDDDGRRIVGLLHPPQLRHGRPLDELEFVVRELAS